MRIQSIDYARGFAALTLPAIHTVLLYSSISVHQSWAGIILSFLAEPVAAPLFMFTMGYSFYISTPKSTGRVLKKVLLFAALGYGLNFFRTWLPFQCGILPAELAQLYNVYPQLPRHLSLILTGDILQFAAISMFFLHLLRNQPIVGWVLFFCIAVISPQLWGLHVPGVFAGHVLSLFISDNYAAFFPVFPWLCYPIAGLLAAQYYKRTKKNVWYNYLLVAGITLLILGVLVSYCSPAHWDKDFYRSNPGRTIYQTGFLCGWIYFAWRLVPILHSTVLGKLLEFCSRHVLLLYCLQWIIIGWGLAFAGYHELNIFQSLYAVFITTALTLAATAIVSMRPAKDH